MSWISIAFPTCCVCSRMFRCNPDRVPAVYNPQTLKADPICQNCVREMNPVREKLGLPQIIPLPGAYDPMEVA